MHVGALPSSLLKELLKGKGKSKALPSWPPISHPALPPLYCTLLSTCTLGLYPIPLVGVCADGVPILATCDFVHIAALHKVARLRSVRLRYLRSLVRLLALPALVSLVPGSWGASQASARFVSSVPTLRSRLTAFERPTVTVLRVSNRRPVVALFRCGAATYIRRKCMLHRLRSWKGGNPSVPRGPARFFSLSFGVPSLHKRSGMEPSGPGLKNKQMYRRFCSSSNKKKRPAQREPSRPQLLCKLGFLKY